MIRLSKITDYGIVLLSYFAQKELGPHQEMLDHRQQLARCKARLSLAQRAGPVNPELSNIQAIGGLLYTRYIFLFEAAGIVLLVAMIGAIVLTHRARGGVRPQNIARQNQRRPQDATRNINQPVGQGVEL